jgi:hypothetical protein
VLCHINPRHVITGAGAGAISAVGLGGIVNLLVQKTISAELTVVQSTAREAFGTGGETRLQELPRLLFVPEWGVVLAGYYTD